MCGVHNRIKHRDQLTCQRDTHGRIHTIRPDGTIILPIGQRPPDLTPHQRFPYPTHHYDARHLPHLDLIA
ncbi:MAG: hypothetical protein KDB37_13310 [Ilumatobacter sp.]|nr:hypothetical protein [Ilumatobacter sp.]